jgi:hypothetical protein
LTLKSELIARAAQTLRSRRRAKIFGITLLALGLFSVIPSANQLLSGIPLVSLGLGVSGLYLLCFRP